MTDPTPRPRHFGPLDHLPPRADTPMVNAETAREMFFIAIDQARQALRVARMQNATITEAPEMTENLAREADAMSTEMWWYAKRKPEQADTPVSEWSKSKGGTDS